MEKKKKLWAILFGVLILLSGLAFYAAYQDMYGNPNEDHGVISQIEKKVGIEKSSDDKVAADEESSEGEQAKDSSSKSPKKSTSKSAGSSSSSSSNSSSQAAEQYCYISIDGYCSGMSVPYYEGDTAYDILVRSGASVNARSSAYGMYVAGINGRNEFDEGGSSGWTYYVNGSMPNVSASSMYVSPGDSVSWVYVS